MEKLENALAQIRRDSANSERADTADYPGPHAETRTSSGGSSTPQTQTQTQAQTQEHQSPHHHYKISSAGSAVLVPRSSAGIRGSPSRIQDPSEITSSIPPSSSSPTHDQVASPYVGRISPLRTPGSPSPSQRSPGNASLRSGGSPLLVPSPFFSGGGFPPLDASPNAKRTASPEGHLGTTHAHRPPHSPDSKHMHHSEGARVMSEGGMPRRSPSDHATRASSGGEDKIMTPDGKRVTATVVMSGGSAVESDDDGHVAAAGGAAAAGSGAAAAEGREEGGSALMREWKLEQERLAEKKKHDEREALFHASMTREGGHGDGDAVVREKRTTVEVSIPQGHDHDHDHDHDDVMGGHGRVVHVVRHEDVIHQPHGEGGEMAIHQPHGEVDEMRRLQARDVSAAVPPGGAHEDMGASVVVVDNKQRRMDDLQQSGSGDLQQRSGAELQQGGGGVQRRESQSRHARMSAVFDKERRLEDLLDTEREEHVRIEHELRDTLERQRHEEAEKERKLHHMLQKEHADHVRTERDLQQLAAREQQERDELERERVRIVRMERELEDVSLLEQQRRAEVEEQRKEFDHLQRKLQDVVQSERVSVAERDAVVQEMLGKESVLVKRDEEVARLHVEIARLQDANVVREKEIRELMQWTETVQVKSMYVCVHVCM